MSTALWVLGIVIYIFLVRWYMANEKANDTDGMGGLFGITRNGED